MAFEFGPGPICWIYMSEVMNEKGVAVATSLNWTFCLIYSLLSTLSFDNSWVFYIFGGLCGLAALFVFFYVKETKDLNEYQLARLYRSDFTQAEPPSDRSNTSSIRTELTASIVD